MPATPYRPQLPPRAQNPARLLLDSREVATLLGLGRTKVFELMAAGELPVIRIGRSVRVPREALVTWIARRTELPVEVTAPTAVEDLDCAVAEPTRPASW